MPQGNDEPARARGVGLVRWDALIVLYAVLAALCSPLTAPAAVAVLIAGAAALVLIARRPPRRVCSHRVSELPVPQRGAVPSRRSLLLWVLLVLLVGCWELIALFWGNDREHPTLSLLLDPILDSYPGRLVGWLGWLAAGRWMVTH